MTDAVQEARDGIVWLVDMFIDNDALDPSPVVRVNEDIDALIAAVEQYVKARCIAAVAGPLDAEGSGVLRDAIVEAIRNA